MLLHIEAPVGNASHVHDSELRNTLIISNRSAGVQQRMLRSTHRGHVALEVALIDALLPSQHAGMLAIQRHGMRELRTAPIRHTAGSAP